MPKGVNLKLCEVHKVVELHNGGKTHSQIVAETGVSKTAVHGIIKKFKETGDNVFSDYADTADTTATETKKEPETVAPVTDPKGILHNDIITETVENVKRTFSEASKDAVLAAYNAMLETSAPIEFKIREVQREIEKMNETISQLNLELEKIQVQSEEIHQDYLAMCQ